MPSSTASSTPRTALPSTARPCANHRKTPASVENLTTTPPSEPLKWSTAAAVRDHRNAVRDRSERCPQSIGITVRIRRNPQMEEVESASSAQDYSRGVVLAFLRSRSKPRCEDHNQLSLI